MIANAPSIAAFLGYNPIKSLVGSKVLEHLSASNRSDLIGHRFFANLISAPFHSGLTSAFIFGVVVLLIAAAASWSRGSRYVHDDNIAPFSLPVQPLPISHRGEEHAIDRT